MSIRLFAFFYLLFIALNLEAKSDKYRCMWREDPSTTMVVAWNQIDGKDPILYLDTLNISTNFSNNSTAYEPDRKVWYKRMNNHFVRLTGLIPDKTYYFIIKDSNSESTIMSFRTLPKDHSVLSIIAGGDSRNHRGNRQKANRMVARLRPHFVMFGGDMTGSDGSTSWKRWLDDWQLTIAEDGRLTPIVAARGNHERNNSVIEKIFDVPNENIYYALTFGNGLLRAYTLNSLIAPGGKQKDWLEKDLDENLNQVKWKIAQYHHPIRPHHSRKSEKLSQLKYWAPLFYEYEMDVVVECDAHVVKTTYPIRPSKEANSDEGFIRDDDKGTIYIGEGCWGAPLRKNNDDKSWTRASGSFNQFKWIWVDYDRMEIRTIKTHNPEEIPSNSDSTRFIVDENLDVWNPETGDVVTLGTESPFDNTDATPELENYQIMAVPEEPNDNWNRTVIAFFFISLIVLMLYPFLPNLSRLKLFNR